MSAETQISNMLSSIIWTASKLQDMHSKSPILDQKTIDGLEEVDEQLSNMLDYEEESSSYI